MCRVHLEEPPLGNGFSEHSKQMLELMDKKKNQIYAV